MVLNQLNLSVQRCIKKTSLLCFYVPQVLNVAKSTHLSFCSVKTEKDSPLRNASPYVSRSMGHLMSANSPTVFRRSKTKYEKECMDKLVTVGSTRLYASVSNEDVKTLETEMEDITEKFNWLKNWWPVQAIVNLKTYRPNKIQLLGKDLIVWKGHSGNWIAMDDECPHRMAPLSEGRIEKDGNLLCSYHAWRFKECGKCVKIPHAEDKKAHSIACNSPRSAVQTYPCTSRGAILWIWPDSSDSAKSDSEECPFPLANDVADYLERSRKDGTYSLYVRYLPYSFDVLVENLLDPSHISVSHHNPSVGLSRYKAHLFRAEKLKDLEEVHTKKSIAYGMKGSASQSRVELRFPGYIFQFHSKEAELRGRTLLLVSPVCTGKSAIISGDLSERRVMNKKKPNFA